MGMGFTVTLKILVMGVEWKYNRIIFSNSTFTCAQFQVNRFQKDRNQMFHPNFARGL